MKKEYGKKLIIGLITFIFLGSLTILSNLIATVGMDYALECVLNKPMNIVLDAGVIIFIFTLIRSISNTGISLGSTMFISIGLSYMNRLKIGMRGVELIPSDFLLTRELIAILSSLLNVYMFIAIVILLGITLIVYMIFNRLYDHRLSPSNRIVGLILSIVMGCVLFYSPKVIDVNGGFLYNFMTGIIKEDINTYNLSGEDEGLFISDEEYNTSDLKPNIVVIMNESFWNPKLLMNIKYNKNPIPNFEALKEESIYGYMESPEFGGGTSNVEFELLTGYSTHFYKPGYLLYPREMYKKKVPTLVSLLNTQGYKTSAIHSFNGWYYKRSQVYKNFGFDRFISKEVLDTAVTKGLYISDEFVSDVIINELKNSNEKSQFIFAVTMQNHGPYNDNRYGIYKDRVRVLNGVDKQTKQILETYSQGVYDADKALGKLVRYLRSTEKPTILLFFGDHLPLLGGNLKIYKNHNFYDGSHINKIKLYSVPFVLWSNYKTESKDIGVINTSFFGSYLLKYSELEMNDYFKLLDRIYSKIAVISRTYAIDDSGVMVKSDKELYMKYDALYRKYQFKEMESLK